ncbi:Major facilitator superfamily domain-containing protein 1 [Trametes pubescens]|uniref:Major facilitator superfamily domain-containing protein 1 n=1 Tax=Trametes pubescens TaxID=154538 RepID=A0A1M2VUJ0_TRAPU|nr:Major facilitator superfamily domain-containing protein 1 [Trametes pubescens]
MSLQRQNSTEKPPLDEKDKGSVDVRDNGSSQGEEPASALGYAAGSPSKPKLPYSWQLAMIVLTCLCTFGNHWSNGLIVSLKTTIIKETHINNSQFATLVAVTNLVNTFLCIGLGFYIDKFGGALMSVVLAGFHLSGAMVMSGAATNHLNSYPLLIVGKVLAAIGDGSLDNAQHRIFSTYFAPGKGFAFSIGAIWCVANLAQFTGQSTANVIATNLGTYAWALWISSVIAGFSFGCAITVFFLDRYLRARYDVTDQTNGRRHTGAVRRGTFNIKAIRHLPMTFWLVVAFAVFENAGVQSFVSISTQFAQQRLKKGAVIGGWVSSFYLLLPAGLTPFLGIYIDVYGKRIGFQSVVQASIVIITTAAGRLQDLSPTDSLDPAVSLWLSYAFFSVAISGFMLVMSYAAPNTLPAARLSQVAPSDLPAEVDKLARARGLVVAKPDADETADGATELKRKERALKAPVRENTVLSWAYLAIGLGIIFIGWIMFGLGVNWGVHGSVIAGTVGE